MRQGDVVSMMGWPALTVEAKACTPATRGTMWGGCCLHRTLVTTTGTPRTMTDEWGWADDVCALHQ